MDGQLSLEEFIEVSSLRRYKILIFFSCAATLYIDRTVFLLLTFLGLGRAGALETDVSVSLKWLVCFIENIPLNVILYLKVYFQQ